MNLISVIVMNEGILDEIFTFPDNPIGVKKAEKKFMEVVMKNFPITINLSENDLDEMLEDGYYGDKVFITHHNCDERG